jgi:hypothetical protein
VLELSERSEPRGRATKEKKPRKKEPFSHCPLSVRLFSVLSMKFKPQVESTTLLRDTLLWTFTPPVLASSRSLQRPARPWPIPTSPSASDSFSLLARIPLIFFSSPESSLDTRGQGQSSSSPNLPSHHPSDHSPYLVILIPTNSRAHLCAILDLQSALLHSRRDTTYPIFAVPHIFDPRPGLPTVANRHPSLPFTFLYRRTSVLDMVAHQLA